MSELPPKNPIPGDNLEQPEDLEGDAIEESPIEENYDVASDEEHGVDTNDEVESDNELTDEMKAEAERLNSLVNYLSQTEQREEQILQERYGTRLLGRTKRWLNTTRFGVAVGTALNYGTAAGMIAGGVVAGVVTGPLSLFLAPTLYSLGIKKGVEQFGRDLQEVICQNKRRVELGGMQRELLEQRDELAGMRVDDEQWVTRLERCVELTQSVEEAQLSDFDQTQRERFRASVAGSVTALGVGIMTGVPLGTHDFDHDKVTHAVRLGRRGLEFVYNAGEQAANGTALTSHVLGHGFAPGLMSAGVAATTLLVSPLLRLRGTKTTQPKSTESTPPEPESIEPVPSESETMLPVSETPAVSPPSQPVSIKGRVRRGLVDLAETVLTMGYVAGNFPLRAYNQIVPVGPRIPVGPWRRIRIGSPPAPHEPKIPGNEATSGTTGATSAEADIQSEEQPLSEPTETEPLTDVERQNFLQHLSVADITEYDPDIFSQQAESSQRDEAEVLEHERQRQESGELTWPEFESARALTTLLTACKPERVAAVVNNVRQQYLDFIKIFNFRPYFTTTTRAHWYEALIYRWDDLNPKLQSAALEDDAAGLQKIAENDLELKLAELVSMQYEHNPRFEETAFMSADRELLSEAEYDALKNDLALPDIGDSVEPDLIMKVYRLEKKRREEQGA